MVLQINLDGNDIKLVLLDSDKIVGELAWIGEYSLSEMLLPKIDEFLAAHQVAKADVERVETQISATSGVTSSRIVQTVALAWKAAK